MPHLRTKLSERTANKRQAKRCIFMTFDGLTEMTDVLFYGCVFDEERLGEVRVVASPAGREALGKIFPGCVFHWSDYWSDYPDRDRTLLPNSWKQYAFDLPLLLQSIAATGLQHNLRKDLLSLRPIDELDPDQIAALIEGIRCIAS